MKMFKKLLIASSILGVCATGSYAGQVMISKGVKSIDMDLNGEKFTIMRNQTPGNKISALYDTTDRGKPQPISLAQGLDTVGELEFIDYMKKAQTDKTIVIVDTRTPGWYGKLRVPGAINIPYTNFETKEGAIDSMEDDLGVVVKDNGKLDFTNAKTIVAYCNGYWCGQTPAMVKNEQYSLLNMGYPASKIKYYRGGMQAWTSLGFTVVGSGK
ncbi:MAG: rhodanese-like domain-containing protein [Arcobacteraceae bacterium]